MKTLVNKSNEIKLIDGQFSVNPDYTQERTGDYDIRDKVAAKWLNSDKREEGCGNVGSEFYFNIKKQSFEFVDTPVYMDNNYISTYRIISPALLLYRLISTFFGTPKCQDNYKIIWEYNLIHKQTGKHISFSEWKGAAGIWLSDYTHKKLDKQFKADLIELANYIVSDKCAHPYDNLVAGSVA